MFVKIYKLGEEQEVTTFAPGTHILGRGPTLQCNDKRVSRNHATLEVTEDNVKLTSIHINPCFLKASDSKTITILAKDSTSHLNDGDSFALLPEDFWFKIKLDVKEENENGVNETKQEIGHKRLSRSYSEDGPPDKKLKVESSDDNIDEPEVASTSRAENEGNFVTSEQNNSIKEESTNEGLENEDINIETNLTDQQDVNPVESTSKEAENTNDCDSVKEEVDKIENQENANSDNEEIQNDANDLPQNEDASNEENKNGQDAPGLDGASDGNPGPAQPKPRREKCWYGAQCYRKNPIHRQDFTHPGDSDFESDPDDNRPSCSFGAACYRKNKTHRQQYKHPPQDRPGKKKRSRRKVDRLNAAGSQQLRDLSQELREFDDVEDPFLADGDSDEYTEESDDDSVDSSSSDDVSDDSDSED